MPKNGQISKNLAVVGLGYVGLPLAILAKEQGWHVAGFDIDQAKVDQINQQVSPLEDESLKRALKQHPIQASTDPSVAAAADVIVVAVPTPVTDDNQPDLTPLTSALNSLLPHLQDGQLLIVESTINPGVMDEVVRPLIPQGVHLAYCPERINPGDAKWTVRNIPRVLGAYTAAGTKRALDFYESIIEAEIKVMNSVTEAEAVKIFENSFRDVNIAFVNEMARSFDKLGIDVLSVIEGATTKPFAFMPHYPGNGVGGHCISVDPYYMIERGRVAGFDHEFLKLARKINDGMPKFTVELLYRGLAHCGLNHADVTVGLLGLAYKKDTGDTRESPAVIIRDLLSKSSVNAFAYDPYLPEESDVDSIDDVLAKADVIMIATNHTHFMDELTPEKLRANNIKLIIDGKNSLDPEAFSKAGIHYHGIGRTKLPATQPVSAEA